MPLDAQGKDGAGASAIEVRKLARYLRLTYGAHAVDEAQRRVAVYTKDTRQEIADIWTLVLMHLRGSEVTDDTHRILRTKRRLTIKTA
jgi:hypothetical protein